MTSRYGWGDNEPKILPGSQNGDRINFFGIKIKALFADLFAKLNVDANKLDGIQAGAEKNKNAFAKIKVGSSLILADNQEDTFEIVPGSNVIVTPDAINDKITVGLPPSLDVNITGSANSARTCNGCGAIISPELTNANEASNRTSGFYQTGANISDGDPVGASYAGIIQVSRSSNRICRLLLRGDLTQPVAWMQAFNEGTWGPLTRFVMEGNSFNFDIVANKTEFNIIRTNANGRTIIRGGTNYNDGASIYLYGKDFSDDLGSKGDFVILVYNATQNSKFRVSPSGTVKINDKEIATQNYVDNSLTGYLPLTGGTMTGSLTLPYLSCNKNDNGNKNFDFAMPRSNGGGYFLDGSFNFNNTWYRVLSTKDLPLGPRIPTSSTWKRVEVHNKQLTLPSGGTWAYAMFMRQTSAYWMGLDAVGVAAGGATITSVLNYNDGFALVWRVA